MGTILSLGSRFSFDNLSNRAQFLIGTLLGLVYCALTYAFGKIVGEGLAVVLIIIALIYCSAITNFPNEIFEWRRASDTGPAFKNISYTTAPWDWGVVIGMIAGVIIAILLWNAGMI